MGKTKANRETLGAFRTVFDELPAGAIVPNIAGAKRLSVAARIRSITGTKTSTTDDDVKRIEQQDERKAAEPVKPSPEWITKPNESK